VEAAEERPIPLPSAIALKRLLDREKTLRRRYDALTRKEDAMEARREEIPTEIEEKKQTQAKILEEISEVEEKKREQRRLRSLGGTKLADARKKIEELTSADPHFESEKERARFSSGMPAVIEIVKTRTRQMLLEAGNEKMVEYVDEENEAIELIRQALINYEELSVQIEILLGEERSIQEEIQAMAREKEEIQAKLSEIGTTLEELSEITKAKIYAAIGGYLEEHKIRGGVVGGENVGTAAITEAEEAIKADPTGESWTKDQRGLIEVIGRDIIKAVSEINPDAEEKRKRKLSQQHV
jgi:chaperonin cofactor prefoldin